MIKEYEKEINWFIEELMDQQKQSKIIKELEKASIQAIITGLGTKEGNRIYQNWRKNKLDELEKFKEKDLNIFERLKRNREQKTNTLFDKLKYFRKGS